MRLSLSTLLLIVALIAVSVAWWTDRRRLAGEIKSLNAECGALMNDLTNATAGSTALTALSFPDGKLPRPRVYDFQKPEDRAHYRKVYGHLMRQGVFTSPLIQSD